MKNKVKFVSGILCCFILLGCGYEFLHINKNKQKNEVITKQNTQNDNLSNQNFQKQTTNPSKMLTSKKADLYNGNNQIALSAITELAELPKNIKNIVENISEENNLYFFKRKENKIFLITSKIETESFNRHGIELIEIDINTENLTRNSLDKINDSEENDNDIWEFDKITQQPLKHIKHSKNGDVEYTEIWNYSEEEPIKYELKNKNDKPISMRKEIQEDDIGIRFEHILYDDFGNTLLNISTNYNGADITRFTYYNSETPDDCETIISEYIDGNKVKETLYSADYNVKNTYSADYQDGIRTNITIYDNENNEIDKIFAE